MNLIGQTKERLGAVTKYAVYTTSRIYHLMRDEKSTKCGVQVFSASSDHHDHGYGSSLKVVESIPEGLRLCQSCSGEGSMKRGKK
jgi:hypothetical protein